MATKKEKLESAGIGILCALASLIISFIFAATMGKDGHLSLDISKLLFPTLIQVNATLIGFWGIVFVYYLKSFEEHRRFLVKAMGNTINKIERLCLKENLSNSEKEMLNTWFRESDLDYESIIRLDISLREFAVFGIGVVASFLASILICILSLGIIEDVGIGTIYVALSLWMFLLGVALSFTAIWATRTEAPKEPEKPKIDLT